MCGCVLTAMVWAAAMGASPAATSSALPRPGGGVYFTAEDLPRLRRNAENPPCRAIYERMVKDADAAIASWPRTKADLRLEELAGKLPDLQVEFVPKQFLPAGGKEAGTALGKLATEAGPRAAFCYLMTGDRRYADFAWDVFQLCAKANRWGWFPWAGSHMPQIHFGIISRNLVLIADCTWEALTPAQRAFARQVLAAKCVEPYYRLVLHTPGMGLYHLRSRNQGNNALAAALIASLFVGQEVPDNRIWQASLLQTYHWAITHDIGWMGQGLESGLGGYWTVSMQNLYTAAAALANTRGVDLRGHPAFEQATCYPIIHETTVPPVGHFAAPIDPNAAGTTGIISGKPIELPNTGVGGPWWFDYAMRFPDSPAHYFAAREMTRRDPIRPANGHQAALGDVLTLAWWEDRLLGTPKPPTDLAQFTDRMAGLRSGYGRGQTYLYFNGDLFLSARNEILCTTSGMSWHFPWHQYQVAETGLETEGEPFAPSMILRESRDEGPFAYFRAVSGFSNVAYYPRTGQRESYTHYDRRQRQVLYVRPAGGAADYFLFVDDVRHKDPAPRWHAWTWHLWDSAANVRNFGRFTPAGAHAVRAERPNADLWIQFLQPQRLAFEQHGIPGQPSVSYEMDHNVRMLRAIAGGCEPAEGPGVAIPPSAWQGLGEVQGDALYLAAPPVPARPASKPVRSPTMEAFRSAAVSGLTGGQRYRLSLRCREEGYRVYEATAWEVGLELLDAAGKVIAGPTAPYGHPDPLKLGAPRSDQKTHDWVETVQYVDAPAGAVACRATFQAVGGAHYFEPGKLWLGPVEVRPVGRPAREREQRFIALVMPLAKGAPPPQVQAGNDGRATIALAGGLADEIAVAADGGIRVVRKKAGKAIAEFPGPPAGRQGGDALATNSQASAAALRAGLRTVLEELAAAGDLPAKAGRRNLALTAKATASATLDDRFAASHVIDNQVAEYPLDGHLDYTLGVVWSSGRFAGYGEGKESLLNERDYFPLYVRPTWWLLPEGKAGHVDVELAAAADVDLVRLLNTSNAGLNDFAAHTFRVELYDGAGKLLAARDGAFGKVFDRPFQQAFFVPEWFSRYTPTFAGMLEPALTVPFGDGWQEIRFDGVRGAKLIRVVITKYWGIGGGLNEVQVYGKG